MSADKLHAGEVDIDASLVGRFLAAQFPTALDTGSVEPLVEAGGGGR